MKIRECTLGTVQEISTGRRNHEGNAFLVLPLPDSVSCGQAETLITRFEVLLGR